ncbi:hypothetical protein DASC09_042790 [Saccharomycopsis crataegensis]|uniref:SET domain-containing protein n=1 Tax=Saccharomycopsis crataegensis TaxID=43959 RepID=A0AAV5QQC9_9ASCO|nr:hypothetical protein DASC09_042790 [Saccharomycopsis crataegensis]
MLQNSSDVLNKLLCWAKSNGAKIHPDIEFTVTTDKGISAFKKYSKELGASYDYQIEIPTEIIITPESSRGFFHENYPGFSSKVDEAQLRFCNSNSITKLFLSYLKFSDSETNSFYQPYIDSLPIGSVIPDSPLLWCIKDKKLLQGTNLGNSIDLKLIVLIKEWYELVSLLIGNSNLVESNELEFYNEYFLNKGEVSQLCYVALEKFHQKLENISNDNKIEKGKISWLSFEAYLWAHLMMTSRSFPYRVISGKEDNDEGILLPVVDLLNHSVSERVEWKPVVNAANKQLFSFKNDGFDTLADGEELLNNYGLKNNEELLLGYGFIIPGNKYETCALKLKLPAAQITGFASEYPGLKLPTPEDFSNISSNSLAIKENSKFDDGLLYFLSKANPIPEELLQIFCLLVKNDYDETFDDEHNSANDSTPRITTRMKLHAINNLQVAIESKFNALKDNNLTSATTPRAKICSEYLKSQEKIFNGSLKALKSDLKTTIKEVEKGSKILTIKKILNRDIKFQEALIQLFNTDKEEQQEDAEEQEEDIIDRLISPESSIAHDPEESHMLIEQIIVLWLVRCGNKNFYPEYKIPNSDFDSVLPSYIFDLFLWFKIHKFRETEFAQAEIAHFQNLHDAYFPTFAEECPEIFGVGSWKAIDLVIANRILDLIRYTRVGKEDIYLLENSFV